MPFIRPLIVAAVVCIAPIAIGAEPGGGAKGHDSRHRGYRHHGRSARSFGHGFGHGPGFGFGYGFYPPFVIPNWYDPYGRPYSGKYGDNFLPPYARYPVYAPAYGAPPAPFYGGQPSAPFYGGQPSAPHARPPLENPPANGTAAP